MSDQDATSFGPRAFVAMKRGAFAEGVVGGPTNVLRGAETRACSVGSTGADRLWGRECKDVIKAIDRVLRDGRRSRRSAGG